MNACTGQRLRASAAANVNQKRTATGSMPTCESSEQRAGDDHERSTIRSAGESGPHQNWSGSTLRRAEDGECQHEREVRRVEDVLAPELDQVLRHHRDGTGGHVDPDAAGTTTSRRAACRCISADFAAGRSAAASHGWQGDITVRRWINEDPFYPAGVREYRPGDEMRRINWKAVARTGDLQVNQFDYTADRKLYLLVSMWKSRKRWRGGLE